MTMKRVWVLLPLLWLAALQAQAQVPMPIGTAKFGEPDVTARIFFPDLDSERGRARLARHLEQHPEDARGWSARAYQAAIDGHTEEALTHLARARSAIGNSQRRQREVLWSEGWVRLTLGHTSEAVEAWTHSMRLHGGRPFWVPYSFAVLSELAGERDAALAWYELAAHSAPSGWGTRRGVRIYTRHWRDSEREAIVRLYDIWAAQR